MLETYDNKNENYITRREFERELLLINNSLKLLNEHFIRSNMLHERSGEKLDDLSKVTSQKLDELKVLMIGDNASSLKNRIDYLEKREHTRRNYEKFVIIILTAIISLEPFTKFLTHVAKLYT